MSGKALKLFAHDGEPIQAARLEYGHQVVDFARELTFSFVEGAFLLSERTEALILAAIGNFDRVCGPMALPDVVTVISCGERRTFVTLARDTPSFRASAARVSPSATITVRNSAARRSLRTSGASRAGGGVFFVDGVWAVIAYPQVREIDGVGS